MIIQAYEKARSNWSDQIKELSYEELMKDDVLEERLALIIQEAQAFRKMAPIKGYFDQLDSLPSEESQPASSLELPEEKVLDSGNQFPDDYFKFIRMLRGGELINLNDPNKYSDEIYIPENIVRDKDLISGDIVKATVVELANNKHSNSILEIVERAGTDETADRIEYKFLLVEKDLTGEYHASRFASGGYVKNEEGDFLRFSIPAKDVSRYGIEDGSVIDLAVEDETGAYLVTFIHHMKSDFELSKPTPKKKVKSESEIDLRDTLFKDISYDLSVFKGKSLVLVSGDHTAARYEEVFTQALGMELQQFNSKKEVQQMAQAIESGVDYAIACPSIVGHDATGHFKEAAKRSNTNFSFSKNTGVKQVLMTLIQLDKRSNGKVS